MLLCIFYCAVMQKNSLNIFIKINSACGAGKYCFCHLNSNTYLSDQSFILQLKTGDAAAYNTLVQLYGDKVYNTVLGILQHKENAEDISQEVFAEIFQSINTFKAEAKLSTWIYRIAVTKSLEFARYKNRKKRTGMLQTLFGMEDNISAEITAFYHPGISFENRELSAVLFKAIARLPENQQAAFILHKTEGLSYNEIAEIMKKPASAIESLLVRAKQNLYKWLKDYYKETE